MNGKIVNKDELIKKDEKTIDEDFISQIREEIGQSNNVLVVLDDDPTGTQTTHNLPVLTDWGKESILNGFEMDSKGLFVLTNSRAYSEERARQINHEVMESAKYASQQTGRSFTIISRGDSTLRGHFPAELEAIEGALDMKFDGWLLFPYFLEGGRFTADDIHYLEEDGKLIPVGMSDFAKDSTFAFKSSNLKDYVVEKSDGKVKREDVANISLEDIREGGTERIVQILEGLENGQVCVVNSTNMQDARAVALATALVEKAGRKLLYRSSASFVQAKLGQVEKPLLKKDDLVVDQTNKNGGLIVVGSYVAKTTAQVNYLREHGQAQLLEVNAANLLEEGKRQEEIASTIEKIDTALRQGETIVIYTSRIPIKTEDAKKNLEKSTYISDGLMEMVQGIKELPRFVISKGGITSSDMATKGLGIKSSTVLGQILPGVPVWKLGQDSKYPDLPFVIFPGNVGTESSLYDAMKELSD